MVTGDCEDAFLHFAFCDLFLSHGSFYLSSSNLTLSVLLHSDKAFCAHSQKPFVLSFDCPGKCVKFSGPITAKTSLRIAIMILLSNWISHYHSHHHRHRLALKYFNVTVKERNEREE